MSSDIRWQQRFSNYCQALAQLETFFKPPALNEREQQGLIKAFETKARATPEGGSAMRVIPENESLTIPGIPPARLEQLQQLWRGQPRLQAVWLFGSRAMGRHGPGSDIDLCLEGPALSHNDRLALMAAVDDLLLPWRVDLVLRQELPAELDAHVQRVGRRIWAGPAIPRSP